DLDFVRLPRPDRAPGVHAAPVVPTANELAAQVRQAERCRAVSG
ncbi:MAG: hypothetical protein ACI8W7_003977, partial [Gammaproteobacteria bacterium]